MITKTMHSLLCICALSLVALGQETDGNYWVAQVSGMSCPLCAKNIERQVGKILGVTGVEIDLGSGRVRIDYADGFRGDAKAIANAIKDAGFSVGEVKEGSE